MIADVDRGLELAAAWHDEVCRQKTNASRDASTMETRALLLMDAEHHRFSAATIRTIDATTE